MSLGPGAVLSATGRLPATIGPGTVPDFFCNGVGFKNGGLVAMDNNAPSGSTYNDGYRTNASGALFVTTVQLGTDIYVSGLRTSILGQILIESANAATFSNGNGITAAGNLAVN
jgi:hypothetical protein